MGFTLKDGAWVENYGERWRFSFFGDHVQLGNFTLRWSWDGKQLTFSEIQGGEEGDEQAWTAKPFVKLDDPPDARGRVPGRDVPGADLQRGDAGVLGAPTTCPSTSASLAPASLSSRSATASGPAMTEASGSRASSATS